MSFTIGSLFDGSGGFPLAASMCGGVSKWASEIEPYPIAVTRSRFPDVKHFGDVSKINGAEVDPVDVITFGSPCQDLSVAGKRAGLKHEANGDDETTRSGLFMEAVRIIKEMREATNGVYPRIVIWENVPGAFSSNGGEDFRTVLEELIKIVEPTAVMPEVPKGGWPYADSYCGDGWSLSYRVFDAQYWGVPQRRRRIYLVADFGGQCAREILFEREGLRGYFTESGTPWQATASRAERCAETDDCVGFDAYNQAATGDVAKPLTAAATDTDHIPAVAYTLKIRGGCDKDVHGKAAGKGALIQTNLSATLAAAQDQYLFQPVTEQYLFENHSQDTRYKGPLDVSPMLPAQLGTGGNNTPFVVEGALVPDHPAYDYFTDSGVNSTMVARGPSVVAYVDTTHADDVVRLDETVAPLQARDYKGGKLVQVSYIVRRLTPTECARLQGFDDRWGDIDEKDSFTDEEYEFWLNVRNTHSAINGKAVKEYSKEQILKWYNGLHTDSAEYKMWGNGIALPNALYVMQGISDIFARERGESTT